MKAIAAIVIIVGLTGSAAIADTVDPGRAFEISDYYKTAFVSAPSVGGPSALLAFSVTRYDLEAAETWSEIWLMGGDGSGLRQMTFGKHHDTGPVFSPNGSTLLFVSTRSGDSQLWTMKADGGEASQLTDFPGGVSDPVFSPDGGLLAVTAEVYPECGSDAECNETIATSIADSPLKVHLDDELLFRHWTEWRDGRYRHILLVDAKSGEIVRDVTPGRRESPVFGAAGSVPYAFSPDGKSLCFVANRDRDQASSTNADLWMVDLEHNAAHIEERNLTGSNPGWDGHPVFSPDGTKIAFISQEKPGYESDLRRLAVLDLEKGAVRYLTDRQGFDNWVDHMVWRPDGASLLFQAQVGGRTPIFEMPVKGGKPSRLHTDAAIFGWNLVGDRILYGTSGIGRPPEIYSWKFSATEARRLTRFNADLEREVDIRPPEEMWLEGGDGRKIHTWIVKPHDFDPTKKYPLILNIHGGPQMQWKDRYRGDWQVYPGKGYVVAFPNPTGSAGFGQDLVDGIACDWNGAVYDDIIKITEQLAEFEWVDGDRLGAMGWSWGGYMMMWLEGHSDRFKALASMMGVYDLRSMYSATEELWFVEHDLCGTPWEKPEHYREWSPSSYVGDFSTPCLVITGERDYRVPYSQSLQFFTDLKKRGIPSRLVVFPEAGHWPSWYEMAFYYTVHLDWFQRWLGGGGPPWSPEAMMRNQAFGKVGD